MPFVIPLVLKIVVIGDDIFGHNGLINVVEGNVEGGGGVLLVVYIEGVLYGGWGEDDVGVKVIDFLIVLISDFEGEVVGGL